MRDFQLDQGLERAVIGGFAFPLGIVPAELKEAPIQGYMLDYVTGEEDSPDSYSFQITVSHDRLQPLVHRAFDLLSEKVAGILEIGSRDAYRSMDVFLGYNPILRHDFLRVWNRYEQFILEDGVIGAGASSEDPFVEVFLDPWKGLAIHVPISMREEVVQVLQKAGLAEVEETWPQKDDDFLEQDLRVRPILRIEDEFSPDVDELLLALRHAWELELNVDPTINTDEGGRELGFTLWHAVVIVVPTDGESPEYLHLAEYSEPREEGSENREEQSGDSGAGEEKVSGGGAYCSIWVTASSLEEVERQIGTVLDDHPEWQYEDVYTVDRVAFDDRPEALRDLKLGRDEPEVHSIIFDPWPTPPEPPTSSDPSDPPRPPENGGGLGSHVR